MKSAAQEVYSAMTCDYGLGARHEDTQANNVLDFNGLLRVDHVDRFITALIAWKVHVARRSAQLSATSTAKARMHAAIDTALPPRGVRPIETERGEPRSTGFGEL